MTSEIEDADALQLEIGNIAPICACGSPELVWDWIYSALLTMRDWSAENETRAAIDASPRKNQGLLRFAEETIEDETGRYMALYMLDALGLTEHGTSVHWSWLTDKGTQLLGLLDRAARMPPVADDAPFFTVRPRDIRGEKKMSENSDGAGK